MGQRFWSCVRSQRCVSDCSSATLLIQFKPLAPGPGMRNSVLTCCHVKMSITLPPLLLFFFFVKLNSGHQVSNATKGNKL